MITFRGFFSEMDFLKDPTFISWEKHRVQIILAGCLLFLTVIFFRSRKKCKIPPGPYGLPYVGYFPFLGKKPHEQFLNLSKKYGNIFSLKLGSKLVVILNDWELVKEAFSKNATANRPEKFVADVPNGLGFGGVNGNEWVEQRRFTVKAMKDIGFGRTRWEELVQEELKEVVQLIEVGGPSPLDINHFFACTFTNNVMTLVFGKRLPMGHPDTELVSKCVDVLSSSISNFRLSFFLPTLNAVLTKLGLMRQSLTHKLVLQFTDFVKKEIEDKGKNPTTNENDSFVDEYCAEMQRSEKKQSTTFSDVHLKGNTQVLLLGGSETSRTAFNFILIAMAENQEEQKKVHAELDSVLGKDGRITWANRTSIPYTFATILEGMRWRSLVPINTSRMVSEDMKLSDYDIPKGSLIMANNWALHNDPNYWENPDKFIPERFLLDGEKQINFKADSYIPFSYGKRSCPGELIAMMELLLYFVTLMQKFKVTPEDGTKVKYDTILGLTMQVKNAKLRFIPRV